METPNTQKAKNAMLCMKILLAVSIFCFVYMIVFHFALDDVVDYYFFKPIFVGTLIIYSVHFISFIISVIIFALWLKSVSLFIPIVNLYKPYMIMKKLCGDKKLAVNLWESLWIIINIPLYIFLAIIIRMISFPLREVEAMSAFFMMFMFFICTIKQIIDIPFALITIKVISNIMKKEQVN
jgi:hypothetical protein